MSGSQLTAHDVRTIEAVWSAARADYASHHRPRRQYPGKHSITSLTHDALASARCTSNGQSAKTVVVGREHCFCQVLLALTVGRRLDQYSDQSDATFLVLQGTVRVTTGKSLRDGSVGDLLVVPADARTLTALSDCVLLCT